MYSVNTQLCVKALFLEKPFFSPTEIYYIIQTKYKPNRLFIKASHIPEIPLQIIHKTVAFVTPLFLKS